jgi:hypothetical protein
MLKNGGWRWEWRVTIKEEYLGKQNANRKQSKKRMEIRIVSSQDET